MHHPASPQTDTNRRRHRGAVRVRMLPLLLAGCAPAALGQVQLGHPPGQEQRSQGQSPSFVPGQAPAPSESAPTPAEYSAFTTALGQSPASAQAAAIQGFLDAYPQSSFAPQARRLLALASHGDKPQAGSPMASGSPAQSAGTKKVDQHTSMQATPVSTPPTVAPTRRAIIDLAPHTLTIRADNSSLSQIFRDLSASTGLKVEGLAHDERIYGSFGPGDPHDVISALVAGLGYNFLMVGESSRGVPRQIILSVQAPEPGGASQATPAPTPEMDQEEEAIQDDQMQPEPQVPGRTFVPPQVPGGQGPGANRTTQQMLDELRQMHPPEGAPPEQFPQPIPPQ